jgi:hypothetical protein
MSEFFGFLYARPSFWEGMGRALDLGGTLQEYNTSLTPDQADQLALFADWQTVEDDFRGAVAQSDAEVSQPANG